jgi:hypothetical protein
MIACRTEFVACSPRLPRKPRAFGERIHSHGRHPYSEP